MGSLRAGQSTVGSPTCQQNCVALTIGLTCGHGRVTAGRVDHEINPLRAFGPVGRHRDHFERVHAFGESVAGQPPCQWPSSDDSRPAHGPSSMLKRTAQTRDADQTRTTTRSGPLTIWRGPVASNRSRGWVTRTDRAAVFDRTIGRRQVVAAAIKHRIPRRAPLRDRRSIGRRSTHSGRRWPFASSACGRR